MKNAAAMRFYERCGDLHPQALSVIDSKWPTQRFPFDVLHHQIVRADIVQLANVRVIQSRDEFCFLCESLPVFGVQSFDRDNAVQSRVSRLPHFSHTPGAEERKNLIRTESAAGAKPGQLSRSLYHSSARVAGRCDVLGPYRQRWPLTQRHAVLRNQVRMVPHRSSNPCQFLIRPSARTQPSLEKNASIKQLKPERMAPLDSRGALEENAITEEQMVTILREADEKSVPLPLKPLPTSMSIVLPTLDSPVPTVAEAATNPEQGSRPNSPPLPITTAPQSRSPTSISCFSWFLPRGSLPIP